MTKGGKPAPLPHLNPASSRVSWSPALAFLLFALASSTGAVVADAAMAQTVQPSGVRVSLTGDRSELTVGDVVTLSILVSHPADLAVTIPRLEPEWGPFEVREQTAVQTISADDNMQTIAKQFRVALFAPGDFETPSLPISVRSPDGSVSQVYPSPLRLTVKSVLSSSDDQLKDILPPADLSTPLWRQPAALAVVALAVLALLGVSAYYFYRRSYPQNALPGVVVDTRSPWEIAVQELDVISRLDLPGGGDSKGHYTRVAEVLRTYLSATCLRNSDRVKAVDMSTEEIGLAIRQSSLDHGNASVALELLQEADLVKFANYAPAASRAYEAAGQVRDLVEATRHSFEERRPVVAAARREGGT